MVGTPPEIPYDKTHQFGGTINKQERFGPVGFELPEKDLFFGIENEVPFLQSKAIS